MTSPSEITPRASRPLKMTPSASRVLRFLVEADRREFYGLEVSQQIRMRVESIYDVLNKYADHGWLKRRKETANVDHKGRPPRVFFALTEDGAAQARESIERFDAEAAAAEATERAKAAQRRRR